MDPSSVVQPSLSDNSSPSDHPPDHPFETLQELLSSVADEHRNARDSNSDAMTPDDREQKASLIHEACQNADFDAVARLAISPGGLLEDSLRRKAWPILLGCTRAADDPEPSPGDETAWKEWPEHRDEHQVQLDVDRSFVYYPLDMSGSELERRRAELQQLIVRTLRTHPCLCYFQGYHDIVQVFLLVLGSDSAVPAVARLSLLRIRDFMLPTLTAAMAHLHLLFPIIGAVDRKLSHHLSRIQPFFALSATLTMYAHEIQGYGDIARLFDFLLANEAVMSIYLFATIILNRRLELFDLDPSDPELHATLSSLPRPLILETLLSRCSDLFRCYPPETLKFTQLPKSLPAPPPLIFRPRPWKLIPASSVLKSTSPVHRVATQTLENGEGLFHTLAEEMKRRQVAEDKAREWAHAKRRFRANVWKHRRQLLVTGAVLVGVIGWYIGRRQPGMHVRVGELLCGIGRRVSAILGRGLWEREL
ncbi:hypothetical protein P152DRAFT_459507 [Eremomyces bilateralis CBS 781.70]|uniref:Rab-GAP TBC domain-containing protein n=1 Tax=Eremomyces bilateralis CBS 781.70 TaxID=1392243 RepID=A0A6G1G176_9PEZI|nr:uncharacterized protein P152DRAFT_459507 [Eremomyces bilateralis CBS 781.70]KAF1811559.1 hypothetical protein P152DRAFT_459507 [Eremomyces bilateralis CBS 781.70]